MDETEDDSKPVVILQQTVTLLPEQLVAVASISSSESSANFEATTEFAAEFASIDSSIDFDLTRSSHSNEADSTSSDLPQDPGGGSTTSETLEHNPTSHAVSVFAGKQQFYAVAAGFVTDIFQTEDEMLRQVTNSETDKRFHDVRY